MPFPFSLVLVALLATIVKGDDRDGWVHIAGRSLKFFSSPTTFTDAVATCASYGGVLAYDDDPVVNALLAKSEKVQWIGASDAGHEGDWTWTNGAPVKGNNWLPKEPNNCCGGENCLHINYKKAGKWNDVSCNRKYPFHCQVNDIDGWVFVSGRYLKYFSTPMTFKDADGTCKKLGGIVAYDDHPAVNSYLSKSAKVQWIGATDAGHEGEWLWTNGVPVEKTNWLSGEPNNSGGGEDCLHINYKKVGKWNDVGCNRKYPFHCQIQRPGYAYGLKGRALKVYSEKKSWSEARKTCQAEGGDLVTVDDPLVNAWLADQKEVLWIGATDEGHEGQFLWTNGKSTSATKEFWHPHEPNNCCGGQNCAVVNFHSPGHWDDQGCAVGHPFACQIGF